MCQANVILVRRLMPGRLHDFVVRVIDSKGDYNSMQATISVTNATTPRDRIFPHIPSLIVVPEVRLIICLDWLLKQFFDFMFVTFLSGCKARYRTRLHSSSIESLEWETCLH